jgi:hypothetical protein
VVLKAGDLSKVADGTFGQDANGMAAMHNLLVQYTPAMQTSTAPYLVFVQSIGPATLQPGQAGESWDQVAKDTSVIGGNPFLLRDLTGSRAAGFALAGIGRPQGVSGIVPTTQVASEGYLGSWEAPGNHVIHGTLQGTLTRDYHSRFYPGIAGPPGSCSSQCPARAADISQVAYQPPTPWPYRQNVAGHPYGDVLTCIVQWLNTRLSPTTLSIPVQQNYVNPPPGTGNSDWTAWSQIVQDTTARDLNSLPDQTCHNQNALDIVTVSAQLGREFQSVRVVRGVIADMKAPFIQSEPGTFLDVQQIANTIKTSFPTQTLQQKLNGNTAATGLGIAASLVGIVAAATFPFPPLAAAIGALSGALWVASEVATSDTGAQELPALPKPDLNGPALDLETQLSNRYSALANSQGGFDHLGDLLVSDWGKLHTAATNAAAWDVGPESAATLNTLETSATRQAWETLFPQAYTEYNLSDLNNYQICWVTQSYYQSCLPASHYGTAGNPSDYACLPMRDWPRGFFTVWRAPWKNKDGTPATYNPFGTVAASDWFQAPGSGGTQNIVFALPPTPVLYWWSENQYNSLSQTTPPQSLTDQMFVNPGDVPGSIGLNPLQFAIDGYGLSDAPNGRWGGGTANLVTHAKLDYNDTDDEPFPQGGLTDGDWGTPCLVNASWVDSNGNWQYPGS